MQNQVQTESLPEQTYKPQEQADAPLAASEVELLATSPTELTYPEKSEGQNTLAVHQWLASIQRKARHARNRYWGLFIFFQAFLFLPICLSNSFPVMHNHSVNPTWLALLFLPVVGMALLALWAFLRKPPWNAEELARVGGVKAVGILLDLLSTARAPKQSTPLYAALIELLPQMKAGDAATLSAGQRRMLLWALKNNYRATNVSTINQNFRLAILKALEQIGDASAIPVVEHLAKGRVQTTPQKALQAAAIECLALLQVNIGGVEATKTLLRASAPQYAPDMLLRPAEFTSEANPKQLLRAADTTAPPPPSA